MHYCLQMDNNSIEELLKSKELEKRDKKYIQELLENFDYSQILKLCEDKLNLN